MNTHSAVTQLKLFQTNLTDYVQKLEAQMNERRWRSLSLDELKDHFHHPIYEKCKRIIVGIFLCLNLDVLTWHVPKCGSSR